MPKDSHVVKYFNFMADLLSMGPPVYFVVKPGLEYEEFLDQNLICGGIQCNKDSINTKIYIASQFPNITTVVRSSSSWIDDYIDWLSISSCCKYNKTDGSFCLSNCKVI
jgi:Niemann-Pick C1 protein